MALNHYLIIGKTLFQEQQTFQLLLIIMAMDFKVALVSKTAVKGSFKFLNLPVPSFLLPVSTKYEADLLPLLLLSPPLHTPQELSCHNQQ